MDGANDLVPEATVSTSTRLVWLSHAVLSKKQLKLITFGSTQAQYVTIYIIMDYVLALSSHTRTYNLVCLVTLSHTHACCPFPPRLQILEYTLLLTMKKAGLNVEQGCHDVTGATRM